MIEKIRDTPVGAPSSSTVTGLGSPSVKIHLFTDVEAAMSRQSDRGYRQRYRQAQAEDHAELGMWANAMRSLEDGLH